MKRKIFYSILCIFLVSLVILLFYIRFIPTNETKLRVGYNVESLKYAPLIVAHTKDFFAKHRVEIETIPLKSGKEVMHALSVGQIDIGLGSAANVFIPISKGAPIKIIAPMTSAPTYLFVRPDNEIRTFEDLLGKTIVASPGGTSDFVIRYALTKEKIDVSKINFVDVDKAYKSIALMEKKMVDAVPVGEDELERYLEIGAVLHEEWETKGYINLYAPEAVVIMNEEFKLSHPLLAEQFINALIDGHRFMKSNPEEAAQMVLEYIKKESGGAVILSLEDINTVWKNKKLEHNLWYDPTIFVEMSKIAVETRQIESNLTLDQIFDLSFEKKLKNAQNEIYKKTD